VNRLADITKLNFIFFTHPKPSTLTLWGTYDSGGTLTRQKEEWQFTTKTLHPHYKTLNGLHPVQHVTAFRSCQILQMPENNV
jgi:hypothetical protein